MATDEDIDALYGTSRRRLVAKALRPRLPDTDARELLILAAAVLLALDEDINEREVTGQLLEVEPAGPSVEQQIRRDAVTALLGCVDEKDFDLDEDYVSLFEAAERVAGYIRDGKVGE